jgi:hypothetical protein
MHNNGDDRDEVRMRQLDEVSMSQDQQLLIAAIGSGFTHSRLDSGQLWGTGATLNTNNLNFVPRRTDENTGANSSYRAFIEENKSDIKIIEHDLANNTTVEKFEVIREDDTLVKDSFYSPKNLTSLEQRLNSDLKKFEDDHQYYQPAMTDSQKQAQWLQQRL